MQAERAVEALAAFLPERVRVIRDGARREIAAQTLVPGGVLSSPRAIDMRRRSIIEGSVELDLSALNGESLPANRSAGLFGRRAAARTPTTWYSGEPTHRGGSHAVVTHRHVTGWPDRGRPRARRPQDEPARATGRARYSWFIAIVAVGRCWPSSRSGLGRGSRGQRRSASRSAYSSRTFPRLAADDHAGAGLRGEGPGEVRGCRETAVRGGDTRLHNGHLHRQDRDPDREPDARNDVWTSEARSSEALRLAAVQRVGPRRGQPLIATSRPSVQPRPTPRRRHGRGPDRDRVAELAGGWDPSRRSRREARRRLRFRFDSQLKRMTTVDELRLRLVSLRKGRQRRCWPAVSAIAGRPDRPFTDADRAAVERVMNATRAGLRVLAVARRVLQPGAGRRRRR